jgi:hypothetical protein
MQKRPSQTQQQGGGAAPNNAQQRKAWTRPSMNGPGTHHLFIYYYFYLSKFYILQMPHGHDK